MLVLLFVFLLVLPLLFVLLLVPLLFAPALCAQEAPAPKLDVKVLYAGVPGERTDEWRAFLTPRAASVETVDVEQFSEADANGFDLVILDCPDPLVRKDGKVQRIRVPKPKQLSASFDRPTIVVGGMALITDRLELKSNWL